MSYSQNSFKGLYRGFIESSLFRVEGLEFRVSGVGSELLAGGYVGDYIGKYHRGSTWDARSLDYS